MRLLFWKKKKPDPLADINPNERLNFNDFALIDEVHTRAFQSFELMLDTVDYVPEKFLVKVSNRIFKILKKYYRKIKKTDKRYQKWFKKHLPELLRKAEQSQNSPFPTAPPTPFPNIPDIPSTPQPPEAPTLPDIPSTPQPPEAPTLPDIPPTPFPALPDIPPEGDFS